jgi:ABC-type branched-subunit amino acid transport system ATPase component
MGGPILETEDLTKSFGSLVANSGITMAVESGSVHGIIGPNGSGKSTFFNTLTGFYTPDRGTVRFDGEEITGWRPDHVARRGLGRTFQIPSPFADLTVRENMLSVFTGGLRSGLRVPPEKRERAAQLLGLLEIDHIADQEAGGISGGQEKLLELGRVLMLEPECVLLDEPTAGVNPALQKRLMRHLDTLNDRGTTFVVIEHDMSVIADICDRVTVFNRGEVVVEGSFEEVTGDERVREAYLGRTDHEATLAELVEQPDGDGSAAGGETGPTPEGGAAPAVSGVAGNGAATAAAARPDDAWLVAEDVVSGYGNHTVVEGVSVRSREGITCIFGPNGSGKSTLLKTLVGVVPAWSGRVTHRGTDITGNDPSQNVRRGITMLPQDGGIFGGLSVRENLLLGGYTVEDAATREERLEEVLDAFPALEGKLEANGHALSGGQQMMLSYGRAMMTGAELYLLDEPSSGLAPSLIDDVFEMTERLVESGAQVFLIEQNVREAMRIADYAYILAQGRLQFDGTPDELTDEDEVVDLYLGLD